MDLIKAFVVSALAGAVVSVVVLGLWWAVDQLCR